MISWTKLLTQDLKFKDSFHSNQKLEVIVWNITSQCNLNCRHCYFLSQSKSDAFELSTNEAEAFIDDISKLDPLTLIFSGGEPLLRKDIFKLANFARSKGIKTALSTNGTQITTALARKIKDAGFSYVGISLDGKEKTNDAFRNNKGSFKEALGGLRNCQKAFLKVGLRFTLTKFNLNDLAGIFNLVKEDSIPRFCIYHLVYSGRGSNLRVLDLSRREKIETLNFIWGKVFNFYRKGINSQILTVDNHADGAWIYLKLKELDPQRAHLAWGILKAQGGNSAGIKIASVDDCGNIYADQFLRRYPLGNIRLKKFSQIWTDPENSLLQALRNRTPYLPERCQGCSFIEICNGNFRARAEAVSGNLWQADPACYLTDEEIRQGEQVYSSLDSVGVNA